MLLRSIEELREYEAGLGIPDLDEGQSVLEHVWLSPMGGVHKHTHCNYNDVRMCIHIMQLQ